MPEFHPANPEDFADLDLEALDDDLDDLNLAEDEDYATDAAAIADLFSQLNTSEVPSPSTEPPAVQAPSAQRLQGYLGLPAPTSAVRGSYLSQNQPVEPVQAAIDPPEPTKPSSRLQIRYFLASGPVLGSSLVAVVVALAFWLQPGRWLPAQVSKPATLKTELEVGNLKQMEVGAIAQRAVQWFQQGNLPAGQQAVTELLDRSALTEAETALAAVPRQQADMASIHFLKGRLAWQGVQQGNSKYRLEDAQINWETAVRQQPTYPLYYNVLGLVYYAQNKLGQADRTWFQALYLLEQSQATPSAAASKSVSSGLVGKQQLRSDASQTDVLMAYAGLTLVLMKTARQPSIPNRAEMLSRATQLHQKVMGEKSSQFRPEVLRRNWMWTPQMIRDWQAIANQKP